jgi:hypothetical protein
MLFNEDTRYRGIFQDWKVIDSFPELFRLKEYDPDAPSKMAAQDVSASQYDFYVHDASNSARVKPEEIDAVRNPSRPLAKFELEGLVMRMVVGRWETNGIRELWQAEMKEGFHAEWSEYPANPELFYITEGEVEFTVYGSKYVAHQDCLVKIPKFAPRSMTALSDAKMYDLGGLTMWYLLLLDYSALDTAKRSDKEAVARLKAQYGCCIKSIKPA